MAAVGVLVLGFVAAAFIAGALDLANDPFCDVSAPSIQAGGGGECIADSSGARALAAGLQGAAGVFAGIAALLCLAFAITGRNGRRILVPLGLAIILTLLLLAFKVDVIKY